jgi:uncharacterized protein (UPF0332 family)
VSSEFDSQVMVQKARESLASAEADFAARRYNSSANRAYFACFQATVAIFLEVGLIGVHSDPKHSFVQSQFVEQLIKRRKLYPARLAGFLPELMNWRHTADYDFRDVSRRSASEAVRMAADFVAVVLE